MPVSAMSSAPTTRSSLSTQWWRRAWLGVGVGLGLGLVLGLGVGVGLGLGLGVGVGLGLGLGLGLVVAARLVEHARDALHEDDARQHAAQGEAHAGEPQAGLGPLPASLGFEASAAHRQENMKT